MTRICLVLAIAVMVTSCAENSALIRTSSTSSRTDVFEEQATGGKTPQGFSDLNIVASFKTHKAGIYSVSDVHGTPDYRLLLNIDGQAVLLRGNLQRENVEPRRLYDPEAGDGIVYRFQKKVRLKSGTHQVLFAVPDDGIVLEREVNFTQGGNSLVVEPVYGANQGGRRPGSTTANSFTQGICGFRLMLNGKAI